MEFILSWNHKQIHCGFTFFLLRGKFITPQLSSSFSFCTATLRNSSLSWQFLARTSWKGLFLISNSSHSELFSLRVGSVNWSAWKEFHTLGSELHASFIKSNINILHFAFSSVQLIQTALQITLSVAAHSRWQAWSAFLSRKSWMSLCSDRILSVSIWESCTLPEPRFLLPCRQRLPEAWTLLRISPGFVHAWMCLRTRDTEWDSTYFALLREQWRSQPSHVCCVADFRRIQSGREVVSVRVEVASSRRYDNRSVLAADFDESLGLVTCERGLFSQSAKA